MNERLKYKLTPQVAAEYFQRCMDANRHGDTLLIILLIVCFPIGLIYFFVRRFAIKGEVPPGKGEMVEIFEDTLLEKKKVDKRGADRQIETEYHMIFEKSEDILVGADDRFSELVMADYYEAKVGQKYYVAKYWSGYKWYQRFFSQKHWRMNDPDPETIRKEMEQEQALIDQIIASGDQSFFTNEIRDRMNEPRALKVPAGKPREELSLVEQMAVDYCAGFVAPALEYIYRYCSPELKQQVLPHFTETQMNLYEVLQKKVDKE